MGYGLSGNERVMNIRCMAVRFSGTAPGRKHLVNFSFGAIMAYRHKRNMMNKSTGIAAAK